MNNTALGAEKAREIIFISDVHEIFYYDKLKEVRYHYGAKASHAGFRGTVKDKSIHNNKQDDWDDFFERYMIARQRVYDEGRNFDDVFMVWE